MLKDVEAPGTLRRPGRACGTSIKRSTRLSSTTGSPTRSTSVRRRGCRGSSACGITQRIRTAHDRRASAAAGADRDPRHDGVLLVRMRTTRIRAEPRPSGIASGPTKRRSPAAKCSSRLAAAWPATTTRTFRRCRNIRNPEEIVQGPDLSGVGTKFAKDRNPNGPDWLYSWIKNPTKYHARTVMPNLFLDARQRSRCELERSERRQVVRSGRRHRELFAVVVEDRLAADPAAPMRPRSRWPRTIRR